ncbi:cation-transporting P-type ATPase [Desulfobacter hydrogenophilus]|uniref:Cation-transporting P-type ATPase n=1 Tax=Desulfobacter hydrogenophilus TaxID=2291 RepID=A0A328F9C1_9BACT|nr:HAD-IC family P-type ATPase [Desulfobacter hydrogenophilus]NDY74127.1 HAD-IC family P-type ATPase [Desulfobacter hydrogenophilus]QBH15202.1 HAD family hydrolase [Desulfobacter hydrogenophilus]RAM00250.1 cation-transporting P-type ATPase [Desulfobacter hydrogenophilus]
MNNTSSKDLKPEAIDWHTLEPDRVFATLHSNEAGLTADEATERLRIHGPNLIRKTKQDGILRLLWRQINNSLIWVLLASGTLAILLGKMTDGLVVLSVVLINAVIGFVQEFKAGRAIEALSEMVPQNAIAIREGKNCTISASELVPGDVVLLAAGDSVAADMRLVSIKNLQVEEAALTGESVPVEKNIVSVSSDAVLGDRTCMVYSGTLVTTGTATAVVTATGIGTELGRISDMLESTVDLETPLTKKLDEVSTYITIGISVISVVILAIGMKRALDIAIPLGTALKETLIFAIALAVGAIPEGLPAVVTIALAIGVQRMARRNAIIRKLPAVETLGSTTVICSDKTGTLTCNEMTVTELRTLQTSCRISGNGYDPLGSFTIEGRNVVHLPEDIEDLLTKASLCNDATLHQEATGWNITGDPTEAALLVAAAKAEISIETATAQFPRLDSIPFSSENQYMATLHGGTEKTIVLKGAPEVILSRCHAAGQATDVSEQIIAEINRMGTQGMRVLAIADKQVNQAAPDALSPDSVVQGFTFLGLIGMIDPPRIEAVEAIKACHQAGIEVKMITGDHRTTALAIGTELNLAGSGQVVTGVKLATMDAATLQQTALTTNIFARVAPEHKLRLVRALQKERHIVAMTGDGVNDAPSLKQANIGVAMGITGTAVSKESADIVLADDNFASISAAVEEGRRVYDNLIKSLAFLLPTNLGLALILIYGIMFFPFDPVSKMLLLPMLPTQLLWINLVAAVALALPLAFEVKEPDIMHRPPRNPDAPLFTGFVVFRVVAVSLLMTAGTIVLFTMEYQQELAASIAEPLALAKSQTMAVTFVILFQIFYMTHCRSLKDSLLKIGFFSNPTVFWGIGVVLALQGLFIYLPLMQRVFRTAPLSFTEIGLTTAAAFIIFPAVSLEKWIRSLVRRSLRDGA